MAKLFHQRSRLGHDVFVIASLRPEQRRLQRTWVTHTRRAAKSLYQYAVHAEHVSHGQEIPCHDLFGEFAIKAIELIEAGAKRRQHMPTRPLFLLSVNVVAQGFIQHGLELTSLSFSDLAQRGQNLWCSLGRKLLADGCDHRNLHHDLT